MSYPNDAPAAAWYPDPQSPGLVRWWDGTNWTEHVSKPANPAQATQIAIESSAPTTVTQLAEAESAVATQLPQIAEADAALAAADDEHAAAAPAELPTYIGRHAAGPNPVPREAPRAPRIRPRERVEAPIESLLSA